MTNILFAGDFDFFFRQIPIFIRRQTNPEKEIHSQVY